MQKNAKNVLIKKMINAKNVLNEKMIKNEKNDKQMLKNDKKWLKT